MKNFLTPKLLLVFLTLSTSLIAQDAVQVDRITFNSLRDDWLQMEIQLRCNQNPAPDARNSRYIEKIGVKAYLAYTLDAGERSFDYCTSEVDIAIMEQGDKNNVYFYLPGKIVERDQLKTQPDFYYVEITIDGEKISPQRDAMSSSITSPDVLNSMVSRADSEGADNEHLLMPIYLVSGVDLGRVRDLPTFLRRDVRR